MDAEIEGEDGDYLKIYVTDNDGTEHDITIEKNTGEVAYHEQDGYPDYPSERTVAGNAHCAQARRFAKFYVYRKRGYETLERWRNPDHIAAATVAVGQLSERAFEESFGELYQQMHSHYGATDPVVEVPDAVGDSHLQYQQDIYLSLDLQDLISMAEGEATPAEVRTIASLLGASALTDDGFYDLSEIAADAGINLSAQTREQLAALSLDALSDIRFVWWPSDADDPETAGGAPPEGIEREPDAQIDIPPYDAASLADFQTHLTYHLKCQVRDCYLIMGIAPPESLRVRGPGRFRYASWYEHKSRHEPYHRQDVEITDWKVDQTPDDISY